MNSIAPRLVPMLLLVAGCSSGGDAARALPQSPAAAPHTAVAAPVVSEAQSDALRRPQPAYTSSPADLLYVGNPGNNSITVYAHNAGGNVAPLRVIAGPNTGINGPGQLSEDAAGNLYVANGTTNGPSSTAAILVFAHGANGNVAPIRTVAGPLTGLHYVEAMTVDQTTGKMFVFDEAQPSDEGASSLLRFPPNANGNEAPFARSPIGLEPATELASDSTGFNVIEAHTAMCCNSGGYGVSVLAKQFANGVAPQNVSDIYWFPNSGVADDPTTKTYLVTTSAGIVRFNEGTNGHGQTPGGPPSYTPPIVSTIASDTCGTQLALGYLRNIYVAHSASYGCPADAIVVYAHDSSGNVAPLRVLSGPATKLDSPYGIYEGQ